MTKLKRFAAIILAAVFFTAAFCVSAPFAGATSASPGSHSMEGGALELRSEGGVLQYSVGGGAWTGYDTMFTITQTSSATPTANTVKVLSGTHNITLSGVNISATALPAFGINSGAAVNLTLSGTNKLQGGDSCAGLQVPKGATLTITGTSGDTLEATGGSGGAGGTGGTGGTIAIGGGDTTANAAEGGAGIGGGAGATTGGAGGDITINGGDTKTTGGGTGSGLGGGANGAGAISQEGSIAVNGGSVIAIAGADTGSQAASKAPTLGGVYTVADVYVSLQRSGLPRVTPYTPGKIADYKYLTVMPAADYAAEATFENVTTRYPTFEIAWSCAVGLTTTETNRATVKLLKDVTAAPDGADNTSFGTGAGFGDGTATGKGCILVPENDHITLDLNGKALDRGLAHTVADGFVIHIYHGDLTICDTSSGAAGKITGGNNDRNAGGVRDDGTLTMTGGSITGNISGTYGGGVGVGSGKTFNMLGGSITNNTAVNGGGGVAVSGGSFTMSGGSITNNISASGGGGIFANAKSFEMSGSPVISGNTGSAASSNVFLQDSSQRIGITAPLSVTTPIGVSAETNPTAGSPVNITTNTNNVDYSGSFAADKPAEYHVKNDDTGGADAQQVQLALGGTPSINITPSRSITQGNAPANETLNVDSGGARPSRGDFGRLEISLNGGAFNTVDAANYDVTYHSIHLALHQSWLNTLPVGTHTLRVYLADIYAGSYLDTTLIVSPRPAPSAPGRANPATGA